MSTTLKTAQLPDDGKRSASPQNVVRHSGDLSKGKFSSVTGIRTRQARRPSTVKLFSNSPNPFADVKTPEPAQESPPLTSTKSLSTLQANPGPAPETGSVPPPRISLLQSQDVSEIPFLKQAPIDEDTTPSQDLEVYLQYRTKEPLHSRSRSAQYPFQFLGNRNETGGTSPADLGPCRLEPSLWQGITPQQYTEWEMEMLLKLGKVSTFLLTPEPVTSTPLTPQERENRIDAIAENFQPRSNTLRGKRNSVVPEDIPPKEERRSPRSPESSISSPGETRKKDRFPSMTAKGSSAGKKKSLEREQGKNVAQQMTADTGNATSGSGESTAASSPLMTLFSSPDGSKTASGLSPVNTPGSSPQVPRKSVDRADGATSPNTPSQPRRAARFSSVSLRPKRASTSYKPEEPEAFPGLSTRTADPTSFESLRKVTEEKRGVSRRSLIMGSESGGEDTSPEKNDSMGFPPVPELPLLGSGKPRTRGDSVGHRSSFSDNESSPPNAGSKRSSGSAIVRRKSSFGDDDAPSKDAIMEASPTSTWPQAAAPSDADPSSPLTPPKKEGSMVALASKLSLRRNSQHSIPVEPKDSKEKTLKSPKGAKQRFSVFSRKSEAPASGSPSSPVVGSPGLESGTSSVPLASPHRLPRSGTPPTTSLLSTGSSVKASPRLERQNSKGSLPLIGKVSPRQATTTPARPALHLPSFRRRGATATSPRTSSAAATISTSSSSPRDSPRFSPRSATVHEGVLGGAAEVERTVSPRPSAAEIAVSPPISARDLVADGATLEALNNLVGMGESPRREESPVWSMIDALHLTPDILSYGLTGDTPIPSVSWKSGAVATSGNELKPADVQEAPTVQWSGAEEHSSYLIVMTDPDAPTRTDPRLREWWHWIQTNIPGNALKAGKVFEGVEHWTYIPPGPAEGSGLHRFVFLIYKQKSKKQKFEGQKGFTAQGRGKNHVEEFAKKHGLGHPVAVAAFQAQYDEAVPPLHTRFASENLTPLQSRKK